MNQSIKIPQRAETHQNDERTSPRIDTKLARARSLDVLARALGRQRSRHPKPELITMLIGQCKRYGAYPGMGPKILETIEAIETAA